MICPTLFASRQLGPRLGLSLALILLCAGRGLAQQVAEQSAGAAGLAPPALASGPLTESADSVDGAQVETGAPLQPQQVQPPQQGAATPAGQPDTQQPRQQQQAQPEPEPAPEPEANPEEQPQQIAPPELPTPTTEPTRQQAEVETSTVPISGADGVAQSEATTPETPAESAAEPASEASASREPAAEPAAAEPASPSAPTRIEQSSAGAQEPRVQPPPSPSPPPAEPSRSAAIGQPAASSQPPGATETETATPTPAPGAPTVAPETTPTATAQIAAPTAAPVETQAAAPVAMPAPEFQFDWTSCAQVGELVPEERKRHLNALAGETLALLANQEPVWPWGSPRNLALPIKSNKAIRGKTMEVSGMQIELRKLFGAPLTRVRCASNAGGGEGNSSLALEFEQQFDDQTFASNWRLYDSLEQEEAPELDRFEAAPGAARGLTPGGAPASRRTLSGRRDRCQRFLADEGQFRLQVLALRTRFLVQAGRAPEGQLAATMLNLKVVDLFLDHELRLFGELGARERRDQANRAPAQLVRVLHEANNFHRKSSWLVALLGNWLKHEYRDQLVRRLAGRALLEQVNSVLAAAAAAAAGGEVQALQEAPKAQ